jgi:hypothetical protein
MSSEYLRRYTNIPALTYLLSKRAITLLDPQSWDDSNDSHYLTLYREKKHLKSVLALCFTQGEETYHHWRVFASGSSGVSVRFHRSHLLNATAKQEGIRTGNVQYLKLAAIRKRTLAVKELPFLKRFAFEHENEYRMIYESITEKCSTLDIRIPLASIDRITLSPWIPEALTPRLKKLLWSIPGCSKLRIFRSTLIGNEEWKALACFMHERC